MDAAQPFEVLRLGEYRQLLDREGVVPWEVLVFGVLSELDRRLASKDVDVVMTNSLDSAFFGKCVSLDRHVPWAATFHEQTPEAEPMGQARLKMVYHVLRPDLILAGSEFYATRARLNGRENATVLIPHGVDTRRFRPEADRREARLTHGLPQSGTILLCAARLTARKGIDDLIQAFARLASAWPDVHLVIAGTVNSSNRAYAEALHQEVAEFGLSARVIFDESAQPVDMPSLFAAADIVVQPSRAEGLGLAVLEGMCAGRAVVTTDIPPTHQIAKGEDVLVMCPPSAPDALAAAIETLLADDDRRARLGHAARTHAVRWFSQDAMIDQTEQVLTDLVSRWRHGRDS